MREPQYHGFLVFGFLLQRPTIPTLTMFPILVVVYARLAHGKESEVARFGDEWSTDAAHTPAFVPRLRSDLSPPRMSVDRRASTDMPPQA